MSSLFLPTTIHGLFSSRSTFVRILGQWLHYLDSCAMPTPSKQQHVAVKKIYIINREQWRNLSPLTGECLRLTSSPAETEHIAYESQLMQLLQGGLRDGLVHLNHLVNQLSQSGANGVALNNALYFTLVTNFVWFSSLSGLWDTPGKENNHPP